MPKANEQIDSELIRLIDDKGHMVGVIAKQEGLNLAKGRGFDLVEISPNADPPVCKMLDFGKYKFEQQRKKNDGKKKQKVTQLKEIKVRPTIDVHDYQVKLRNAERFLKAGDKVKFSLRFRGREITHSELGMELMQRIKDDLEEVGKVELEPKMDSNSRQVLMILAPRS